MNQCLRHLTALAREFGITVPELVARRAAKPAPYVAVSEDSEHCLHIVPRVHAPRTLHRLIHWTGNGRASEWGEVK